MNGVAEKAISNTAYCCVFEPVDCECAPKGHLLYSLLFCQEYIFCQEYMGTRPEAVKVNRTHETGEGTFKFLKMNHGGDLAEFANMEKLRMRENPSLELRMIKLYSICSK